MNKKIFLSLFISILIHGVLLWSEGVDFLQNKEVFAKDKGLAAIKVSLSVYEEKVIAPPPKPKGVTPNKKKKEKTPKAKTKPNLASKSKVNKTQGTDTLMAKYLGQVRSAIVNNKFKSRIAKKMKMTGSVKIFFMIKVPNRITDVKVLKPSRFKQLNKSALQTLANAKDIPKIPAKLKLEQIPITVEITYQ